MRLLLSTLEPTAYNEEWLEEGMPTYAYGCDNCGVRVDRFQSFVDPALTTCPECGEQALRRLILPVGIVFKGSGFYSTDHPSPSGQASPRKSDEGGSAGKESGAKESGGKASSERKEAAANPAD